MAQRNESVVLSSSVGTSFTWYNGTTVVGTSRTFTAMATGDYTVEVTNGNGCKTVSDAIQVEVSTCSTTAIAAGVNEKLVKVFPNPFMDEVQIQLTGSFRYKLYDSKGSLMTSGEATDIAFIGNELQKGLYLLQLENPYGNTALKIIKE